MLRWISTNGTLVMLGCGVVALIICPPKWDPTIRGKWRRMGYPSMGWRLERYDYYWIAGSSLVLALIAGLYWLLS